MLINPVSINGNLCREFMSSTIDDLSVIVGGYIITPRGEIILVDNRDEHCNVFSDYINAYLETGLYKIYDSYMATKILTELGCCVYSGLRYDEYIENKSGNLNLDLCSLTFPSNFNLTDIQRDICKMLISKNKSSLGDKEKIYIQYGTFPDNVYPKKFILDLLEQKSVGKENRK